MAMLGRQRNFHLAAEYVASAIAEMVEVQKVALFGSVATPLKEEVPRFREFRRAVDSIKEARHMGLSVYPYRRVSRQDPPDKLPDILTFV